MFVCKENSNFTNVITYFFFNMMTRINAGKAVNRNVVSFYAETNRNGCYCINFLLFNIAAMESEDQNRLRFQIELEFVQCLANPNYIHCKLYFYIFGLYVKYSFS